MRGFLDQFFWTVFILTLAIGTGLIVWIDRRCPDGVDCTAALIRDVWEWQTLIAGILAVAAAALVLFTTRWHFDAQRQLASRGDAERLRAARMRIAYQLELFAESYRAVLREIELPGLPLTPTQMFLPQPALDFGDLRIVPPSESEALLSFAHGIAATNEKLFRTWHARQLATQIARLRAVRTLLEAIEWRNRYAPLIGWSEVGLTEAERERLQQLLSEKTDDTEI